ncbi:unnamed protein product [Hermetia illucens]|uniref:Forkhead box protein O n=1 Tax=Hermetia illucens TaxID=343691 RepID=A0A7R8V078_HERIL|nr:unnamed protein product [Hermetia illucens]
MDQFEWLPPQESTEENLQMDYVSELQDGTFEPQTRTRSNTWPLRRPDNFAEPSDESESTKASNQQLPTDSQQATAQSLTTSKKNSSRRNAWGNLSYADLITHAIGSATDKRLTLSQIYEWMVQNVPYFKDKGDSNSSAGWKNSIRHNLSLHNRFVRVQNEGTGKSSWWMLNPDAKPGKSVRRRAASMETSKYEKRRGRAKKRVEALRNAGVTGLNDATPSPSSSVSEGLDHFPESPLHSGGFQLSPDFRQRASSNASSCGRLSPIPAVIGVEPDWSYPQAQSSSDFNQNTSSTVTSANTSALDQLAGSLADELTFQNSLQGFVTASGIPNQPPPPYQPPQPFSLHATVAQSYGMQANQCPLHGSLPCACLHNSREGMSPSSGTGMSPSYPHSEASPDTLGTYTTAVQMGTTVNPRPPSNSPPLTPTINNNREESAPSTLMGQFIEALNNQQTQIEEFNLDTFQGGLECNVEELIQQELSIDGLLDINIPITTSNQNTTSLTNTQQATTTTTAVGTLGVPQSQSTANSSHTRVPYSQTSVTPPSWVH